MDGRFAAAAWDVVTSGIQGVAAELAAFKPAFVALFVAGSDSRRFDRDLTSTLRERQWTWPWFDEWDQRFADWGAWPTLWPELAPDDVDDEEYSEEEIVRFRREAMAGLISHTALMVAYRDWHLSKAQPYHRWRLVSVDEVEKRVAEAMSAPEVTGPAQLPPFFPGDRTTLQNVGPFGGPSGRIASTG